MNPADMLAWTLGVHGVTFTISLAGLYRYVYKSMSTKILADTDDLLGQMNRKVATAIEEEIAPVFERAESEPRIVSPHGYSERPIDPVHSDAFREAIRRFLQAKTPALVEYRQVYQAREKWYHWSRNLNWIVYFLSAWEIVCLAVLGLGDKIYSVKFSEIVIDFSFLPTAVLIFLFFLCKGVLLHQHNVINDKQTRITEF